MTAPHLPGLEPTTQRRQKIRRTTRQSSIAQYAIARETLATKREAEALRLIAAFWNRYQFSPTIGELADRLMHEHKALSWKDAEGWAFMGARLWLARGVSGLIRRGLVEAVPNGERKCRLTGVKVETWRVTLLGRKKLR